MTGGASGRSEPRSSPMTLRDGAGSSVLPLMTRCTTGVSPRSCMRCSIMASSSESAAPGMRGVVES